MIMHKGVLRILSNISDGAFNENSKKRRSVGLYSNEPSYITSFLTPDPYSCLPKKTGLVCIPSIKTLHKSLRYSKLLGTE